MDRMQKQSLLIMMSSIEQQLSAMRSLVMIEKDEEIQSRAAKTSTAEKHALGYTSDEEDRKIGEGMNVDDKEIAEREAFLQDIFRKSQRGIDEQQ